LAFVEQNDAVTAGAGIADARAVGVEGDVLEFVCMLQLDR
jgi:hypothetical protein